MSGIAGIHWWRALLAGFLAEVVLMVVAIVFYLLPDPAAWLEFGIPPISFVVFVGFGYWAARKAGEKLVLHGLLTAVLGIALYFALLFGALSVPGAPETDYSAIFGPSYLLAHGLKLIGGALGGLLADRMAARGSAV